MFRKSRHQEYSKMVLFLETIRHSGKLKVSLRDRIVWHFCFWLLGIGFCRVTCFSLFPQQSFLGTIWLQVVLLGFVKWHVGLAYWRKSVTTFNVIGAWKATVNGNI